jgi:membrane protease YdiL (CAAX protease family)
MSYQGSPPPPLSRGTLVIGLYAAMGIVAFLLAAGRGDPDVYRLGGSPAGWQLMSAPVFGVVLGLFVVVLTRVATSRFQWARDLYTSFKDLLGPLTGREIVILALASSIGEELLFRGALMPWCGVWIQAAVFAVLHIGPGRRFLPWTLSAFVLGVAFGLLAQWTGNIGGPIAAHFTINYLNLKFIVAAPARPVVAA